MTNSKSKSKTPQPLSLKEKQVLEFIEDYLRQHGISPTYKEICSHFGFASFNSAQRYLKQLEAKKYIQLPWSNQKRAIQLLQPASALQNSVQDLHRLTEPSVPANTLNKKRTPQVIPALLTHESFSIPLLGRVAAGVPLEALEHDEFIDVPASLVRYADRTYALRVQGQSMIEDGILDGDLILVQRQTSANNGEIVVAVVDNEATVKRFYTHRGERNPHPLGHTIELRPANSEMESMWFKPSDIQIRGIVVGLIRKFI